VEFVIYLRRRLYDHEFRALAADPYQFLIPK